MPFRFDAREQRALATAALKWGLLGSLVGIFCGTASASFLYALDAATALRETYGWLLFLLPVGGLIVAFAYDRFGESVAAGNNLLIDVIHAESDTVTPIPLRMAPLILFGTVVTHLFGGSAGREGTAVQMGGSLASALAKPLGLDHRDHRILLMAGIGGGFSSVFGTPLAGTVFALEVLSIGTLRYEALAACFAAATVGDITCRALGIVHHVYTVGSVPALTPLMWALILFAGVLFAVAAVAFGELTEAVAHVAREHVKNPLARPALGGIVVIALTYLVQSREYLGLSLPLIERSFTPGGVVFWAFALKLLFTSVTLGTGFKGGEVTPLFGIGATLGSAFARLTHQPTGFFAALGFAAVFAGAANTPLACVLMGIELFGAGMAVPLMTVCLLAYLLSGHRGIYGSQRIGVSKTDGIAISDRAVVRGFQAVGAEKE